MRPVAFGAYVARERRWRIVLLAELDLDDVLIAALTGGAS